MPLELLKEEFIIITLHRVPSPCQHERFGPHLVLESNSYLIRPPLDFFAAECMRDTVGYRCEINVSSVPANQLNREAVEQRLKLAEMPPLREPHGVRSRRRTQSLQERHAPRIYTGYEPYPTRPDVRQTPSPTVLKKPKTSPSDTTTDRLALSHTTIEAYHPSRQPNISQVNKDYKRSSAKSYPPVASRRHPSPTVPEKLLATNSQVIPPRNPTTRDRRKILFYHKNEPYYGFTNFSPHSVTYEGKRYPTSEHLFQSFKFQGRWPGLAEHIRTCSDRPSVAFSEARRFQPQVRSDWLEVNIGKMDVTLWHKFTKHRALRDELLATGDAELVENSDKDSFWGIGADGKGRNELGKALERLRTKFRGAHL